MNCKFCQHDLTQVGCCGKTGLPILLCTGCGSLKLCDQEQLPSPLWGLYRELLGACELMAANEEAVTRVLPRPDITSGFAEGWGRMKVALTKIGGPKS